MLKGISLTNLSSEFPELRRYTKVGDTLPVIEPVSVQLGDSVAKQFEIDKHGNVNFDIVGLDHHGVVSIAEDPWSAFEHVERLEHICKIFLS
jgi:L-fuculose-phosphate aldolase